MLSGGQNSYSAAIYLRLSRDDGDKAESDSITNQRDLIYDFLKKHTEITVAGEFIDDGYSGTNFNRPGFQNMFSQIENGSINCVIVKDLSRFGRNYIETGKLLERIFPALGIRFIAITDNLDTINNALEQDAIMVPFKNLINDAYSRDISIKTKSQIEVRKKNGKFIGGFPPYGYMMDPAKKGHLIIDPDAADIVREIFAMKLDGYNAGKIAEYLNKSNVLTPTDYKQMRGSNYKCHFKTNVESKWQVTKITEILKNEIYIGNLILGKTQKVNYKVKQCRKVAPEKWIRAEGVHEAIITKSDFDIVQKLLATDTRTPTNMDKVETFAGLIICGGCGEKMIRRSFGKKGKKYVYYACSTKTTGKGCSLHLIDVEKLEALVTESIRKQIDVLIDANIIISKMENTHDSVMKSPTLSAQILAVQKDIERYKELKMRVYQDMTEGVVSEEEYGELSQRFENKLEKAMKVQNDLQNIIDKYETKTIINESWIEEFIKYRNIKSIDRKTLVNLVDKIIVHNKNEIEIVFRHCDEIKMILELASVRTNEDEETT